ncbi:MAG TPA: hypothetical protein VMG12_18005 [Polyangiaceae bacterium]|nr:hypothetical protein [Polyangiaceae bacterium]
MALPLLLGTWLVACAPSRQALTAGEVGCPPSELSISGEASSTGWSQSADTWVAECRGRRFICSEVTTSSLDYDWLFSNSVDSRDSDVSCHEELSASAPLKIEPREPPLTPRSAPPSGGAGFELGSSRQATRERCVSSGHEFRDEGAQTFCSGAAAALGFDASMRLTFCKDTLCGITISQMPKSAWATAFKDLDMRLTEKYGPATVRQVRVPSMCRSNEQFDRCATDGALDFEVRWQWPEGDRLRLLLDKPATAGEASLRLMYVMPPDVRRGDTSAL